jgi:hypothetical protein
MRGTVANHPIGTISLRVGTTFRRQPNQCVVVAYKQFSALAAAAAAIRRWQQQAPHKSAHRGKSSCRPRSGRLVEGCGAALKAWGERSFRFIEEALARATARRSGRGIIPLRRHGELHHDAAAAAAAAPRRCLAALAAWPGAAGAAGGMISRQGAPLVTRPDGGHGQAPRGGPPSVRGPRRPPAAESMRLPYRTFTYGETYSRARSPDLPVVVVGIPTFAPSLQPASREPQWNRLGQRWRVDSDSSQLAWQGLPYEYSRTTLYITSQYHLQDRSLMIRYF